MILTYPSSALRTKCIPINKSWDVVEYFVPIMLAEMYVNQGIGLAAPQIGLPIRLIVLNPTGDRLNKSSEFVMVNPEIIWRGRKTSRLLEGCLSLPGTRKFKIRPNKIKVKFQDLKGNEVLIEAEGLISHIIQHEIDHLDGKLIIDS